MPQLDKVVLGNTIFWFVLSYFSMYYIVRLQVLPYLSKSLKFNLKLVRRWGFLKYNYDVCAARQVGKVAIRQIRCQRNQIKRCVKLRKYILRIQERTKLVRGIVR